MCGMNIAFMTYEIPTRKKPEGDDVAPSSVAAGLCRHPGTRRTQARGGRVTHTRQDHRPHAGHHAPAAAAADGRGHGRAGRADQALSARASTSSRWRRAPATRRTCARCAGPRCCGSCASLGDTIFLLVRSGFDAVCLDRCEGPFPIRSFTGDIGGRVALGVGQGALAILAFCREAEREEVIRFNLPRVREFGVLDEVYLRTEIEQVRAIRLCRAQHRPARRHGRCRRADRGPRGPRGRRAERRHDLRPAERRSVCRPWSICSSARPRAAAHASIRSTPRCGGRRRA